MEHIGKMLKTHPRARGASAGVAECVTHCHDCAATCTSCADACLGEAMVAQLTRCIRLNLDCADICAATANVLTRQTDTPADVVQRQLEACAAACRSCAQECEQHADHHEHCRVCAEACRACERACEEMLQAA